MKMINLTPHDLYIVDATHAAHVALPTPVQHAATVDALPVADARMQALQMAQVAQTAVAEATASLQEVAQVAQTAVADGWPIVLRNLERRR